MAISSDDNPLKWTPRQKEIFNKMSAIVVAMNDMSIDDLSRLSREIDRDEAIGPLVDPTKWTSAKFEEARIIKIVVRAVITFKKEVSGVGRFHNVEKA